MKIAIVTGASGNLGKAVIEKFLEEGYHVVGTVIPNDSVGTDIHHKEFETAVVDLMNEDAAQQFVELIAIKYEKIDVAVLTVGGFAMGDVDKTKAADLEKQYKLNFETTYHVARPVFKQMIQQHRGRIFMIGSRPGYDMKNSKGTVAYGLAKSLIFRLAEILNEEGNGHGVSTAVIVPSTIDTPQNRASMPDADHSKWVKAEDIAAVIHFHTTNAGSIIREPVIKVYGDA